ncbi:MULTISPECIES: imidazole glycerol phosphate synthase subunit HisH [Methanothermobacter]|uniref:Imidazole glycerol phosphate synthase subunit HisH n=2 Tax=Methanothermobacter TaxID=145260 RepID=A0A371NBK2_9EURY|nr:MULTISPECIES: imidazole glycerol phosphate synthase subunit HisH [Methanothermobacter]MBC7111569.1 imidazole glycerol phosphate synthase subunit HisH [Methanothermobacter sp.]NLU03371.1 imidazole glycerol phosphate synthase subunit HisH [Methanothermobacter sp.]REE26415.1 imidazole glycerol phosphate synthase subunit HisH [Methanothermobacter defluvii]WBF07818.1 imidazole glycerol phosphate synthase subunit HisH [Methanothermobacter thermautotrophicus]BAM70636.1 imidazole glycerol phosphate
MIAIIDYGSGNLRSIANAFRRIGADARVTSDPQILAAADALVLPGVGAFGSAMAKLEDLRETLLGNIRDGKPFLGICLGLQVLLSESQESPGVQGLDLIPGRVIRIPPGNKVPHMGWNQLVIVKDSQLLEGAEDEYFYFVHSYYAEPSTDVVVARTDYGVEMTAAIESDNIHATQFHPEKSGEAGLDVLRNFVEIIRA